jgi:hypothetical protein
MILPYIGYSFSFIKESIRSARYVLLTKTDINGVINSMKNIVNTKVSYVIVLFNNTITKSKGFLLHRMQF